MVKVKVSWQGKKYDVDVDTTQPGEIFKMQLFSLTGVSPERQKILVKGGQLKDDTDMSHLGLKDGQILRMMGTVGELPKAPEQAVKFMEDMGENEVAQALAIPAGLTNMGNTCYMNATLQCMKAVPELQKALAAYPGGLGQANAQGNMTAALSKLFKLLSESGEGVAPIVFLQFLRQVFPKFAERDPQFGGYRQQDAEECYNEILTALGRELKDSNGNVVDQFMGGMMETTWRTEEAPEEAATVKQESFRKLDCHIDKSVSYVHQGIKQGLEQTIEKHSEALGRNAHYTATSRIARLPEYLTVAFNRFFWKASESVDAKIVKAVKFPLDLDVSEFCTPELQDRMRPVKQRLREIEDRKAQERKLAKRNNQGEGAMDTLPELPPFELDAQFKGDQGCNPSGMYELVGVITHIGRTANSGHYMAWVRKEKDQGGPDPSGANLPETSHWWYKFDDDVVSMVTDDDVLKLCGGGDWHTAYVTLYRAKRLE
ncbi:cysteine proteinase [Linderina pennispora]|uniref:Ubiquitin carboxyl-terminal hydrolase n=1 Tax=Linderina pennispora TaxID=61395 RepID=A0A1Y1WKN9_9FUNG|nr:cysteine proteinase [Linderina pennispora]ORX74043.1 cysteine proteinase [Linderina pennispora]